MEPDTRAPAPRGRVSLVGAGPGARDLITVRGLECLRAAEVVVHDDLASASLLDETPASSERIYAGKRGSAKTIEQAELCALLVERARAGKRVVRLKGGDPFVFGRGAEEAEALAEAGVPFEVVPGVSSAIAAPAFAGIPVTHRELSDGFEVWTGHEARPPRARTLVLLMGTRRLEENTAMIERAGYPASLPAALIERGTTARQRTVVATLGTIAAEASARGFGSPAVLVVGETVALREKIRWFEARPLHGRRVLVTRARHQAGETCRALEAAGAETVAMPTIAIQPPGDLGPLREAVRSLARYQYLILTSANAVPPLREALEEAGLDARALAGLRICAIGPGTAAALRERFGIRADLVPADHRAEGILEALAGEELGGARVLLPRAERAREILPETLRARGAEVDLVVVYRTGIPGPEELRAGLEALERGEVDTLSFTSASTVESFAALLGPRLAELGAGKLVVAIGPVTRDACRAVGLEVQVMPERYTIEAMVEALCTHLRR
jgi:uroporphyrinogen III methyltransferase/synthase